VFEEQAHYFFTRLVVLRIQLQRLEVLVFPDQICRGVRKQIEEVLEIVAGERGLQILDDVELDVALAQDVQRAARLPSAGVVVDEHFLHLEDLRVWIPGFGDCEASRPSSSLQAPLQFVWFICSRR